MNNPSLVMVFPGLLPDSSTAPLGKRNHFLLCFSPERGEEIVFFKPEHVACVTSRKSVLVMPCQRKGHASSKGGQVSVSALKAIDGMAQESSSGCLSIPLSTSSAPVAWRSCVWVYFSWHPWHVRATSSIKRNSKPCPKGWACTCVPGLCHVSWQWRRDLLQSRRGLKIPEAPPGSCQKAGNKSRERSALMACP